MKDSFAADKKSPPFHIAEQGWGEFDMAIVLRTIEKGQEFTILHDLNFANERYEARHTIVSHRSLVLLAVPFGMRCRLTCHRSSKGRKERS